jgi:hypothetical protein
MVKSTRGSRGAAKKAKKDKKMQSRTEHRSGDRMSPQVDARIQREIGKHLRAHYIGVINEPVPDRFIELLKQLESSVKRKS